jgi:hypothetical protein
MAFIIPMTPTMRAIIERIALVAPRYGDADTWLFPSRTSFSGHMEEERDATHRLRRHALIRFTMHQLRHNVGTAAEKEGYRRSDVAEILHPAKSNVTDRMHTQTAGTGQTRPLAVAICTTTPTSPPGIDGLNTAAFESSWRALVTTPNSEQRGKLNTAILLSALPNFTTVNSTRRLCSARDTA